MEVTPGRKLNIANGVFEIPDTHPKLAPARTHFRIDGAVPAAVALLASDGLRDDVGISLDPGVELAARSARRSPSTCWSDAMCRNSATYTVTADLTNFAADKLLMGQKVEASALRVSASSDGFQITGDVKINGTPASINMTKKKAPRTPICIFRR